MTWSYVVTNTGNAPLIGVVVTDDMGVSPVYVSGDTNGDAVLDLDEVWVFEASGTAVAGQYANTGSVSGSVELTDGGLVPASDSDLSHYFGVVAGIDIEKSTNGVDADVAPGPSIAVGDPVTWSYVVTNTGNVQLTGVSVVDSVLGAVSCPQDVLAVGESMTCTATGTATAGQYQNTGSVTGSPAVGGDVSDSDDSHYFGVGDSVADVSITKVASSTKVTVGDTIVYTISVANAGPDDASDVIVTDVLPGGVTYVSSASNVGSYDPATGRWDVGTLGAGETVSLEITVEVVGTGTITNTASVASTPDPDPGSSVASAAIESGDSLPATGLEMSLFAAWGLALLALGALLLNARRRHEDPIA